MATVHVLHSGYNRGDNVGSSVTFVRDGGAPQTLDVTLGTA